MPEQNAWEHFARTRTSVGLPETFTADEIEVVRGALLNQQIKRETLSQQVQSSERECEAGADGGLRFLLGGDRRGDDTESQVRTEAS